MAKKIKVILTIQIPAGKATPAPPIGPALAQHGVNISEFCQRFNDMSKNLAGFTIPAEITVYDDRSYALRLKQPPAAELIKKAIGIEKGFGVPQKTKVGKITKDQLRKVAKQKMPDLNTDNIDAAMKIIAGTARNMGVDVVDK